MGYHKATTNHDVPATTMNLAGHLYESFLHGSTADVVLRVEGTWCAIYRLHRVVLIQAGFFRTLFTSEFEEAKSERKEIDLIFDDTNITRAAFELCIGRLYGGGPPLYIYPEFTPNPTKPLTPAFPSGPPITSTAPDKHQPASPRFLLSLLATSLYLEIPSIASHALSSVLATIGPYTVIDYMNFARGKPIMINPSDTPAVGLEHIAEITGYHSEADSISVEDSASISSVSLRKANRTSLRFYYGAISDKIGEACACWLARWGPDMFAYEEASASPSQSTSRRRADTIPSDHFGLRDASLVIPPIFTSFRPGQGLSPKWIRALVSSDSFFVADEQARYTFAKRVVEFRRRLRKSASVSTTVSVTEKGKETQQNSFLELPDEEVEEREWTELFENGIYYSNMTPADLLAASADISPTTNYPYVPLHILQAANWEHARLRQIISTSMNSPSGTEKEKKDLGISITGAEVYIARTRAAANQGNAVRQQYFLVPHDQSLRVGDTINTTGSALAEGNIHNNISMDQLFQQSFSPHARTASGFNVERTKNNEDLPTTSNERTFFGLLPDTIDSILQHSPPSPGNDDISDSEQQTKVHSAFSTQRTYTTQPPFRFSIEFWDLDLLKEKQRLYSQTVWYAGSLFNVYVQVAKKKESISGGEGNRERERGKENAGSELQLGIYLHRQSTVEAIPPRSAPSPVVFLPQEIKSAEGVDANASEVAELREGESVLIGMAPLHAVGSNSPPASDTGTRRDNGSGGSWLRTHARGPSLPLGLGSSGTGSGAAHQSPQRSGTPITLSLTRTRTPVGSNSNNGRTRPGTSSSLTPSSSSSGSTGFVASSLPNEALNIQFLSLSPNPTWMNAESVSTPNSPVVGQTSPSRPMTASNSANSGASGASSSSFNPYTSSSPPYTTPSPPPVQQPYRDPRQVVSVYFSVYCASATGSRQTRFRSGPDVFKIGQSWGWKSGGLLGSQGTLGSTAGKEDAGSSGAKDSSEGGLWALPGRESSFRATVILGVV